MSYLYINDRAPVVCRDHSNETTIMSSFGLIDDKQTGEEREQLPPILLTPELS